MPDQGTPREMELTQGPEVALHRKGRKATCTIDLSPFVLALSLGSWYFCLRLVPQW